MAELAAGSSGWSYPSWRPDFYPAGLAPEDFLASYAGRLGPLRRLEGAHERKLRLHFSALRS